MTRESVWRSVLIGVLSAALATQGLADKPRLLARPDLLAPSSGGGFEKIRDDAVIGIVVAAVAIAVVVVVLLKRRPQRVTGCVSSGANGMSVTDEKDHWNYTLSGKTAGVRVG
ncbi:MAG: hypothetical protein ACLP59_06555 [Bryobacteraceae bacterium]